MSILFINLVSNSSSCNSYPLLRKNIIIIFNFEIINRKKLNFDLLIVRIFFYFLVLLVLLVPKWDFFVSLKLFD